MEQNSAPAPLPSAPVALQFTGRAGEYFKIWIVNICLSVITLGIYSAWAKVRRKRYFYGSTLLQGSAFEYLGKPVAILKGRILVVIAFAAYGFAKEFNLLLAGAIFAALALMLPWIVQRALQFNARNSMHRSLRFGFRGTKLDILGVLLVGGILVPITLGLAYPFYLAMKRRTFVDNSSYGDRRFSFSATTGDYYRAALKVSLVFIGFLVGSIVTVGLGALPLYLLLRAYAETAYARLSWRNTRLADISFDCRWKTGELFVLYFVNSLGVLLTLGLLVPWAAIRSARYKLERITLQSEQGLGGFFAVTQEEVAAVGDEAGELLGFDFGL
ncbi:MAG: DUF898 domain-containing protein [Candidatus Parcubacteria bacterium]|nr:DUF898 domain-containing protein [Burkholderiales bacterium]